MNRSTRKEQGGGLTRGRSEPTAVSPVIGDKRGRHPEQVRGGKCRQSGTVITTEFGGLLRRAFEGRRPAPAFRDRTQPPQTCEAGKAALAHAQSYRAEWEYPAQRHR